MTRKQVVGLCLSVFLMMLGVGMMVPLLPRKVVALSGSVSETAYLAAFFAVPYVFLQVPCGRMADRFGFKPFLICAYVLCSLAGFIYRQAEGAGVLFAGRLLQGMGEVPVWALAPAMLSLQDPAEKGKLMGLYNAVLHLGLTMGPLLGASLADKWTDGGIFLFYSAVCFLGAVVVVLAVREPKNEGNETGGKMNLAEMFLLAKDGSTLPVLAGIVFYGAGYGLFLTIIPGFLASVGRCTAADIGVFFSLFYFSLGVSQWLAGPLLDRRGAKPFFICGLFLAAAGVGGIPVACGVRAAWAFVSASLGFGVVCLSAMVCLNGRVSPSAKGTVSGVFYLLWGVGYFTGPVAVGELGKIAGIDACLYGFAAVVAATGIVALLSCLTKEQNGCKRRVSWRM